MFLFRGKLCFPLFTILIIAALTQPVLSQQAYYIDGYHGGVWGHYPDWNTRFMVDMLKANPYWKINMEIEPETWDRARIVDPAAYREFKAIIADQSSKTARVEYVNPAYAQSYMFNIDGESIIRQFGYGIKKLEGHFPGIRFTTYSTEEPCFTSALPQILVSYGFKYASLKNPNTCFGGYTRNFGGELVNWIGPDGTAIKTVPRYEIESLLPESTWQTIAWNNQDKYISAAINYGIRHPIGMTLQDAGWKGGPFLGNGKIEHPKNEYTTWRNYFENISAGDKATDWMLSQEDVLVSLVWGSQVTQRIAQQVRTAENKILRAEKAAAISKLQNGSKWPQAGIDSAWRTLLLSQHHDCWIVPYNGKPGDTWADKVVTWTANTDRIADSIVNAPVNNNVTNKLYAIRITNTQISSREEVVTARIPGELIGKKLMVTDGKGTPVKSQISADSSGVEQIIFIAKAPAFGYTTYYLKPANQTVSKGAQVIKQSDGKYLLQSDQYSLIVDPAKGGAITSLVAKAGNKEFVDQKNAMGFNMLRGNFYNNGGTKTSATQAADIEVLENGPVRIKLKIKGEINNTGFSQVITMAQGQKLIDIDLKINWQKDVGVGDSPGKTTKKNDYYKPFYNDTNKLLAVFPLALQHQKVYKNAPFDVIESKLGNTFFTTWDSIKNNILLNWVDVVDGSKNYGLALFSDHTTSYTHGESFPLGLTLQYSGGGLWWRSYFTAGPSIIHYALMPHTGDWSRAGVWSASVRWNEPLIVQVTRATTDTGKTWLACAQKGISLTAANAENHDMVLRIFNAEASSGNPKLLVNFKFKKAELINLNGEKAGAPVVTGMANGGSAVTVVIPQFGFRTIKFTGVSN